MTTSIRLSALLLLILVASWCQLAIGEEIARAPAPFASENPTLRGLDSNLYMQTSAEYRACCYQAYNLATMRVQLACTAENEKNGTPKAVIMDLDETVLDNAGFQAMQLRSALAFDLRLWKWWEREHGKLVGLVPGAKEFILETEKRGVAVFYISNRLDEFRQETTAILDRLGIPVKSDAHLKLATDPRSSDKTKRRQEVEKDHLVVLYIGDNLRDFDERFKCPSLGAEEPADLDNAIQKRKEQVDATRSDWGNKWIVLPNSAYGEWFKPLGRGQHDLERLVPTAESDKRFESPLQQKEELYYSR